MLFLLQFISEPIKVQGVIASAAKQSRRVGSVLVHGEIASLRSQ